MSTPVLAVRATGLVSAVGLSAPATCAAIRARLTCPTETRFMVAGGEWLQAHQVALEEPWRGLDQLAKMAALALAEALEGVDAQLWPAIPVLLCVAEEDRPGRLPGLGAPVLRQVEAELGARFHPRSAVLPLGRVGVAAALSQARSLLREPGIADVLVAATDGLVSWPTLDRYHGERRLLTAGNSNGFMPGEGAGALRVGLPEDGRAELCVTGIGFGDEPAHVRSGEPLRGDGLARAIKAALHDAGVQMHDMDYRITDLSGEQYYFKEAALALSRVLRVRKADFDLWHPAECLGECGAAVGPAIVALADSACRRGHGKGSSILAHMAADAGARAAIVLQWRGAP